jgi:hypothetical protein
VIAWWRMTMMATSVLTEKKTIDNEHIKILLLVCTTTNVRRTFQNRIWSSGGWMEE